MSGEGTSPYLGVPAHPTRIPTQPISQGYLQMLTEDGFSPDILKNRKLEEKTSGVCLDSAKP